MNAQLKAKRSYKRPVSNCDVWRKESKHSCRRSMFNFLLMRILLDVCGIYCWSGPSKPLSTGWDKCYLHRFFLESITRGRCPLGETLSMPWAWFCPKFLRCVDLSFISCRYFSGTIQKAEFWSGPQLSLWVRCDANLFFGNEASAASRGIYVHFFGTVFGSCFFLAVKVFCMVLVMTECQTLTTRGRSPLGETMPFFFQIYSGTGVSMMEPVGCVAPYL